MSQSHSDALVFFGATGDLAYKKIFPSLQAMLKRGHLGVPVIGVAKAGWSLDQLKARARESISPENSAALGLTAMDTEEKMVGQQVELLASRHPGPEEVDAYERVLGDAMEGDPTLFAREDYVEEAWRIVDPVLKKGTPVYEYEPGTCGPKEVDQNVSPPGGWQNPVVEKRG